MDFWKRLLRLLLSTLFWSLVPLWILLTSLFPDSAVETVLIQQVTNRCIWGVKTVFKWSACLRFFIWCTRFRRIALLFFKDTLSFSSFGIVLYRRSLLRRFLFLDASFRFGNDKETIKVDGVWDSRIGEGMTTVESKVCFWDKRCICTFAVTASLCSFNSFLESSLVFL